MLEVYH